MATTKITDLTAYTDPVSTDVLPIVDVTSDVTKKVSIADLMENAGSGSAAAPGISFDGDPNTGIYRPGADQIGVATNGTSRVTVSTTAVSSALPVDVLLGAAATPSYTFTGDLNTGIYSPGADQVAISSNSSERIRIGANGEIGLSGANYGTSGQVLTSAGSGAAPTWTTPSAGNTDKIEEGNSSAEVIDTGSDGRFVVTTEGSERLRVDSSGRLGLGTSSPQAKQQIRYQSTAPSLTSNTGAGLALDGDSTVQINFGTNPASPYNAWIQTRDTSTNLAWPLAINPLGGNVGIGTTSPSAPLHVKSTNPQVIVDSPDGSTESRIRWYKNGSSVGAIYSDSGNLRILSESAIAFTVAGGSPSESARIDSSGRLLVGTSTSIGTANGFTPSVQVAGTSALAAISAGRYAANANPAQLTLQKSRSGTIGSQTVVVSGDEVGQICFEGSDGANFRAAAYITAVVDGTPGIGDMPGRLVFSTTSDGWSSPTENMRISANRNVRIGTGGSSYGVFDINNDGSSTYKVDYISSGGSRLFAVQASNGTVVNSTGTYTTTSDLKLKENIVDASSQWQDIKDLRIVKYNYKAETGYEQHTQIGVIAQEVEQVSPGLVFDIPDTDADGSELQTTTKGVKQSILYMKAVKALQEAMERIETLEAKVAALEAS